MKVAIISDTHFGNPKSTLVVGEETTQGINYKIGSQYPAFKNTVGQKNDYLILLGDIFDFSVVSYNDAYRAAQIFFQQINNDDIAKEIIYVPGNHDFDFWHTTEYEVNVINQMKKGELPRSFRWSVPGVIDDRLGDDREKFKLPDVTAKPDTNKSKYADLFIDNITNPSTYFNIAYPNLYFITDKGESVLLTHGHYLETYWAFLGELAISIADEDLDNQVSGELSLQELVSVNFPLNQLASSGVGQAGPLNDIVRRLQQEVSNHKLDTVKKYLDRIDDMVDKMADYGWYDPREWGTDAASNYIKDSIISVLRQMSGARFSEDFIKRKDIRERFSRYYISSIIEIERLRSQYSLAIPDPDRIIFGHTHEPIPWSSTKPSLRINNKVVSLHNTGGWITSEKNGQTVFCGALIFKYESGQGFSSVEIN